VYPPNFIGGAELIAHAQALELKRMGHDVIVFAGDISELGKRHSIRQEKYEGLTVFRIRLVSEDYQPEYINFYHEKVENQFKEVLNSFSPDVVHFHNIIGLSLGLISIAKQKGIKTVLTLHDNWGFCYKNTIIKNESEICHDFTRCRECMPYISDEINKSIPIRTRQDFFKIIFKDLDEFISPSQYLAKNYNLAGIPEEKMHVIWNGIDVQKFSGFSRIPDNKRIRFTFIGYLGKHKGINVLIDALSYINNMDSLSVNIVGKGELIQDLKNKVQEMGLSNVVSFWGRVDDIRDAYRNTDVFILPSIWPENQPVTITEAMASKIPVIASNLGGVPELVEDGKTGYLFEAGNPKDLAQKMLEFLLHPEKIEIYGEAAYNKIVNNTLENQVKQVVNIYDLKGSELELQSDEEIIIACIGKNFDSKCSQAMAYFLNKNPKVNYRFIMSKWLQEDQLKTAKLLWVVDPKTDKDEINIALINKLPILIPEINDILKDICIKGNCGLYYRDGLEAEACLEFLIKNERERKILGQNCYEYHLKVIKNSEDNKKSLRYQPVKGILPKTLRKLL
jgi:glycosyltransferase involved in cell wall biosynthesis